MGKKIWGQLTAIDLFNCDERILVDRRKLGEFCLKLCKKIGMKAHGEPIIKRFGESDLYGLSAVQFIETSTIVVHLDDSGKRAFIDVFSCKKFNAKTAEKFSKDFFKARRIKAKTFLRG